MKRHNPLIKMKKRLPLPAQVPAGAYLRVPLQTAQRHTPPPRPSRTEPAQGVGWRQKFTAANGAATVVCGFDSTTR